MQKVADFLNLLIRPKTTLEMRAIRVGGTVTARAFVRTVHEAMEFGLRHGRDAEIYMGVAPRQGERQYASPRVLWADVDFKTCGEKAARLDVSMMDMEPSVIVNSGGGLHLYWVLDGEVRDVKAALRGLARSVSGGDLKSAEPAHILRLPGTMNHKYKPGREVKIEKFNPELTYEPWEFATREVEPTRSYGGPTAGSAALALARDRMRELEPAVEGSGGDDATFRAACMLVRDLGLSEDDAFDAMAEWNARCVPPWSDAELRKKIRGAALYGRGEVGADDPGSIFAEVDTGEDNGGVELPETNIQKLDRKFKAVDDAGELRVYTRVWDEALDRYVWQRYRRQAFVEVCQSVFKLPLKNIGVDKKGNSKFIQMGEYWIDMHNKKDTYVGMAMRPECDTERTPDGKLNLWHGFAVKEKEGDWDKVKEMTLDILCRGDRKSYEYVMNWLARAVQVPWEPGKTALVFKGRKGAGKSTLGNLFCKLFGQHGMHITGREQFTGRFNAHLRDCVALFADEAFWAGDKQGESQLKAFITEPSLTFERKGKDPEMGRNYLHVIMASNMDWVVPASMDERRFAVFEVGDDVRSREWWDPLHNNSNLLNGVLPAMLWELRRRDIRGFDVFDVPLTEALVEQKAHAMDPIAAWLMREADRNWLDLGQPMEHEGRLWWAVQEVYEAYMRDAETRNVRTRVNEVSLGMSVRKFLPGKLLLRKQIMVEGLRRYYYHFPNAAEVLLGLENLLGIKVEQLE